MTATKPRMRLQPIVPARLKRRVCWLAGGTVAVPTETVYGLAARADSTEGGRGDLPRQGAA